MHLTGKDQRAADQRRFFSSCRESCSQHEKRAKACCSEKSCACQTSNYETSKQLIDLCSKRIIYTAHKSLTAKINKSIEKSMVNAASSGKLTIMKNATD